MAAPPPPTDNIDTLSEHLFKIYKAMGSPDYPAPDSLLMRMARESILRSWYPEGTARQAAAVIIGDNCDRRELLKRIQVPVVIIHGEADPVVNIAAAREMASVIPQAELIALPGMGHDLPRELIPAVRNGILRAVREK
jgi:pimeloyl-ACP methyl ester carboxylesterase